jgi:UDP-N-acetylglucosamine 2-epimerase (non-hydrolysing)
MKVMTILGTRPEIIRLSLIIEKLDRLADHVLVHTGQNFDRSLNDTFFEELNVRAPNHHMGVRGESIGEQVGQILMRGEAILRQEKPDRLLILGDTNSGLSAIMAKRIGIPVFHMEAGNRCYDDRVPEEVNRRLIDHSSDVLMPYTERSRENLLREGFPGHRVYVTGNPIGEVIKAHDHRIQKSTALASLDVKPGGYILVTTHRAENVDVPERLQSIVRALSILADKFAVPVLVSTHPRTRARIEAAGDLPRHARLHFLEPFGFFDFIMLERNALCVLSDSGTVQEECALFGVPTVTMRDVTERPETIECGSNLLSGAETEAILRGVETVLALKPRWTAPAEYLMEAVSDTVVRSVLSYHHRLGTSTT